MHDRGILRRVFTQNVDGLYQKTGLPDSVLVEYHGNYTKGTIVLYGDSIPVKANYQAERDLVDADLLIVMGSSLQVAPFCALPNLTSNKCTRVLVDLNPRNAMTNSWSKRQGPPMSLYTEPVLSSVEFGKQSVTLRPLWRDRKKYPTQYVYTADCDDCDDWANAVMDGCKLNNILTQLQMEAK
uniref:Sir2 family protein n=1 Tax=Marseillevirus LCMAC201 TaxID=2506605 RepID=A0A481YVG1_9VIRU|nr:MAG: Sir2 family protein [Marseillevirus LCMAC201]